MPWLIGLAISTLTSPVCAADSDADKAKAVAVAFLKAFKTKDLDALMKTVDVPFYFDGVRQNPITKLEDLKAKFKEELERTKLDDLQQIEVGKVLDVPAIRQMVKDKDNLLPDIEKVIGQDGFAVLFKKGEREIGALLVRIKDGKATIVGIPK